MPVTIDYRLQTDEYEHRTAWLPSGPRQVPGLGWADVLCTLVENLDTLPVRFHTVDFLTTMIFPANGGELTAAFCSQGRRRGEVLLSIPATVDGAAQLMHQLGTSLEAKSEAIRAAAIADGIPADYYDASEETDEDDQDGWSDWDD